MSPTVSPVEAPRDGTHCGTTPAFVDDEHLATISCRDCRTKLIEYPFDPGGLEDRTIGAFDRRTKFRWQLASSGICFVCAGRVNREQVFSSEPDFV